MSHEAKGEEEMKLVMMIMIFFLFYVRSPYFLFTKYIYIYTYIFFLLLGTFEYKSIFEQLNRFFFKSIDQWVKMTLSFFSM